MAAERLTSSRDVAATLRAARVPGRLVVLHHRARQDGGPPRLTVVASRRVGTAVARNRAKRLLREAARHLVWPAGTDVVLVARPDCAASELGAVAPDLQDLRERAGWS
ncbi:MAG: ribonuclease P protein component [Nitriliruptorales bacterium]|nr:ribonuclease P protein component [Nitriliruptorales bacterium]